MIDLHNVGVVSDTVTLLAPVSISVAAGDALVVRGENGAGKSTLLRVLAGMRSPSTGSARIAGESVVDRDRGFRRRVAAMIGLPPMAPDLTVRDHVAMVATTWVDRGGSGDTASACDPQQVTDDVLAELGLSDLGARFPHELSSGQTQLFGLALVLARPFEVLVLDEPEQRLDPGRVETVARVLNARRCAGATLVVATHSQMLADALEGTTLSLEKAA